MGLKILIGIVILLMVLIIYIFKCLIKADNIIIDLKYEITLIKSNLKKYDSDKDIVNSYDSNYDIINKMRNVDFLKFLKERFDFPDYCKMCDNFRPTVTYPDICQFKGLYKSKCKEGFEHWLNSHNKLEGDMDANIN